MAIFFFHYRFFLFQILLSPVRSFKFFALTIRLHICTVMKQNLIEMKQNSKLLTIAFLFLLTELFSCSKNDSSSQNQNVNNQQLQQGSWKITNFWDKDHDETAAFSSYQITFNNDGSVSAVSGGTTVTGTWSTGTDDSQPKLILFFSTSPFSEINDDWHITSQTDNLIQLEDVSGGNGTTELLTLEKI